jgi:hypothetical protein
MAKHHRIESQPLAGTAAYFAMRRAQKREAEDRVGKYDLFWTIVSGPEYVARGRELAAMIHQPAKSSASKAQQLADAICAAKTDYTILGPQSGCYWNGPKRGHE